MSSCGNACCTGRFKTPRNEANGPKEDPYLDFDLGRYDGTYFVFGTVRENGEFLRVMYPTWADLRRSIRNLLTLLEVTEVGQVGGNLSVEEMLFLDAVVGPGKPRLVPADGC